MTLISIVLNLACWNQVGTEASVLLYIPGSMMLTQLNNARRLRTFFVTIIDFVLIWTVRFSLNSNIVKNLE